MIGRFWVRDKNKYLIGFFHNIVEAKSFIERNDPKGIKGYYVIKKY